MGNRTEPQNTKAKKILAKTFPWPAQLYTPENLYMTMTQNAKQFELDWDSYAQNYSTKIHQELYSFKRNAWIREIERHIGCLSSKKILDVGTGPGFFPIVLGEKGAFVTGIDNSEKMLDTARANCVHRNLPISFQKMNAETLDFPDSIFDCVIARNITYALSNPEKAYKEWLRVLMPNGFLLIYDANWFHFLVNEEEYKNVMLFLNEYHNITGYRNETYEDEVVKFSSHILSRPLTYYKRPQWDILFFQKQMGICVKVDYNVHTTAYSLDEQFEYRPTPLFVIEVKKYCM